VHSNEAISWLFTIKKNLAFVSLGYMKKFGLEIYPFQHCEVVGTYHWHWLLLIALIKTSGILQLCQTFVLQHKHITANKCICSAVEHQIYLRRLHMNGLCFMGDNLMFR